MVRTLRSRRPCARGEVSSAADLGGCIRARTCAGPAAGKATATRRACTRVRQYGCGRSTEEDDRTEAPRLIKQAKRLKELEVRTSPKEEGSSPLYMATVASSAITEPVQRITSIRLAAVRSGAHRLVGFQAHNKVAVRRRTTRGRSPAFEALAGDLTLLRGPVEILRPYRDHHAVVSDVGRHHFFLAVRSQFC